MNRAINFLRNAAFKYSEWFDAHFTPSTYAMFILAACFVVACTDVRGEPAETAEGYAGPRWALHLGGISYHSNREREYNERNPGLGIEYRINNEWSLASGFYKNSFSRTTYYAYANWTPINLGPVWFGLAGGAVTGYKNLNDGGVAPALVPSAEWRYGRFAAMVNYIPKLEKGGSDVVGVVFKVRF